MGDLAFDVEMITEAIANIKSESEDEKASGLMIMSIVLLSAPPNQLNQILNEEFVTLLCDTMVEVTSEYAFEQATLCIRNLLTSAEDWYGTVVRHKAAQRIADWLQTGENISIAENLVYIIYYIASHSAAQIGHYTGMEGLFKYLDFFKTAEQRTCLQAIDLISEYHNNDAYAIYTERLIPLCQNDDKTISRYAVRSLRSLLRKYPEASLSDESFIVLANSLNTSSDHSQVINLLNIFQFLNEKENNKERFINANINFERLLTFDFSSLKLEIMRSTLNIIMMLLPRPDYPIGFLISEHSPAPSAKKLSKDVRNVIINALSNNKGQNDLLLSALNSCIITEPFSIPATVFGVIKTIISERNLVNIIFQLLADIPDKKDVVIHGLIPLLESVDTSGNEYLRERFEKIKSEAASAGKSVCSDVTFEKFEDLVGFVNSTQFSAAEFLGEGLARQFHKLSRVDPEETSKLDLNKVAEMLTELALYQPYVRIDDYFRGPLADICGHTFCIRVKVGDQKLSFDDIIMTDFFTAIEAMINYNIHNINDEILGDAIKNSPLSAHLDVEQLRQSNMSTKGLMLRVFNAPGYVKYGFLVKSQKYSALEPIVPSLLRNTRIPNEAFSHVMEIEAVEDSPISLKSPRRGFLSNDLQLVLQCLSDIHRLRPGFRFDPRIEQRLEATMHSPVLDCGFLSPGMTSAFQFPFLFSSATRLFAFRMAAPDFYSIAAFANHAVFKSHEKFRGNRPFFTATIDRASLFEEGLRLIPLVASGVEIDIAFRGENGFGSGPLREFLSEMARGFCRRQLRMFRDDGFDGEYCFSKGGLFPAAGADPELYFALGAICGRAVSIDTTISIPLSIAFFKLVGNRTVEVSEVDETLSKSLSNPSDLIGLPYTYPGDDRVSIGGGEEEDVTSENAEAYVTAVTEATIGRNVMGCAKRFNDGFATACPGIALSALTPEEARRLVTGDEISITIDDLQKGVDISHGYSASSPQISMLFEVIATLSDEEKALFVRFVTGSDRLPVGGLAALHPRLTVARRSPDAGSKADDSLPSVSTCTNYLKLPPYSCSEALRAKLIYAINEGQNSFMLT